MKVNFEIQKKTLYIGIAVFFALIVVIFGGYVLGKNSSTKVNQAKEVGTENDIRLLSVVNALNKKDGLSDYKIEEAFFLVDSSDEHELNLDYLTTELTKELTTDSKAPLVHLVNIHGKGYDVNLKLQKIEEEQKKNFFFAYISPKNKPINEDLLAFEGFNIITDRYQETMLSDLKYANYTISMNITSNNLSYSEEVFREDYFIIQDEKANSDGNYNIQDILTPDEIEEKMK